MVLASRSCAPTTRSLLQLTFGIGCMTALPGVRLFCLYTFWGVTFTYLYQVTYFAALMAYCGEMEDQGTHALLGIRAREPQQLGEC